MYKLIACDLDETLLQSDKHVSAKNIEAIQKARELGVKFVLATGRGYLSAQKTLKELGLDDQPEEYMITYNGGCITENKDNQILSFHGITWDQAQALYERGKPYNVCIHVYTKDHVYVYRLWPEEVEYLNGRMAVEETFEENLEFLKGQEISKMLYVNTDRDYLQQIERDLSDITNDLDVSYSSNRYIEFNRKGVNKGAGLLELAEHLGIQPEETIAIGDNFNDLSMIQAAGLGVGVQNTVEGMRDQCDYITKANHNESAIAEVIEKFILNPLNKQRA